MKATIVELRYNMNEVLKALDRNEPVQVLYHGKVKGTIIPNTQSPTSAVEKHPFFGMQPLTSSVETQMQNLRGGRYHAL